MLLKMAKTLRDRLVENIWPPQHTSQQAARRRTRYTYTDGPMMFLGQQICKAMQDAGYPAIIHCCYRDPETQAKLKFKGRSKAGPFQSPHQFYEAVDIVHETLFWQCDDEFWHTLRSCTRIVAEKYGVEFECGYDWGWDMAHIELKDWRLVRDRTNRTVPTPGELAYRFYEVLPRVVKALEPRRRALLFADAIALIDGKPIAPASHDAREH